jgi:hypothetical protein
MLLVLFASHADEEKGEAEKGTPHLATRFISLAKRWALLCRGRDPKFKGINPPK